MEKPSKSELSEYLKFCYQVALKVGASTVDADDAAQLAILNFINADISSIQNPKGWLTKVVRMRYRDILKKKVILLDPGSIDLGESDQFESDLLRSMAATSRLENLREQAADVLSPKELRSFNDMFLYPGTAYTLSEFAGFIAEMRGENAETIRTHLRRVSAKLTKLETFGGGGNDH